MYDDDFLMHHGIKGMKWGVRRYQNADGSLTAAGRKRYNAQVSRAKLKEARRKEKEKARELKEERASQNRIAKAAHGNLSKRQLNKLTNEELKRVNERLKMEQSYKEMMAKIDPSSQQFFKWKEWAAKVVGNAVVKMTDKAIDNGVKKLFMTQDERDEQELKRAQRERDLMQAKRDAKKAKDELEGRAPLDDDELAKKAKRLKDEESIYDIEQKRKTRAEEEHKRKEAAGREAAGKQSSSSGETSEKTKKRKQKGRHAVEQMFQTDATVDGKRVKAKLT